MSGYWAIGNEGIDTAPANTMMSDSTVAKIGRMMKKREIMAATRLLFWRRRLRLCTRGFAGGGFCRQLLQF